MCNCNEPGHDRSSCGCSCHKSRLPVLRMNTPTEGEAAQRLLALSQAAVDIDHANAIEAQAHTLTGARIEASIAAHREVAQACEAFRRRYYPRSGAVFAAAGMVSVLSPKGRRGRIVAEAVSA